MASRTIKHALTCGEIARRINVSRDRVQYFLRSRCIKPAQKAGRIGIYSDEVLDRLSAFFHGEGVAARGLNKK